LKDKLKHVAIKRYAREKEFSEISKASKKTSIEIYNLLTSIEAKFKM
jgi:hypothetical protein